jgi:D-glycero-alpha-D-manno-heptose-7-phosphate kinase
MNSTRNIRSRAPMRVSFGGGGSEIDPYMKTYGGRVMNSTISMYAHTLLSEIDGENLEIESADANERMLIPVNSYLEIRLEDAPKACLLTIAVLHYFSQEFGVKLDRGVRISTYSDAPVGSGLGASSTMTVAIVHTLFEYFRLPVDPYNLAIVAHKVEREYLGLAGGIQDHFCAAFGGFNFMEFGPSDHLLINPLRIKRETLFELESSLMLIYTGTSRDSGKIIEGQISAMNNRVSETNETLTQIANNAKEIKSAILKWDLVEFSRLLTEGWEFKKSMTSTISNEHIDDLESTCVEAGALGVKLCGAGGGGYLLVAIKPENRPFLIKSLNFKKEDTTSITFVEHGSEVWNSTSN